MKKIIALVLIAAALMSLAACGKGADGPVETVEVPAEYDEVKYELALTAEFLDLPVGMAYASAQCRVGDTVWLGGGGESGAVIGPVSLGGDKGGGLAGMPEGCEAVYAMCTAGDNIAVLAGSEAKVLEDGNGDIFESAERLELLQFNGAEFVSRTELGQQYPYTFHYMMEIDGNLYILCRDALIMLAPDGSELGRFEHGDRNISMESMCVFNGELVVLARDLNSFVTRFYRLDEQTLALCGEAEILDDNGRVFSGLGVVNDALTVDTGSGVYVLDGDFQLGDALFYWDELFVSGGYQSFEEIDGGYLFFDPYQEKLCLARWKEARVRKTVVMATDNGYGEALSLASDFNRSQDVYFVKVNVYQAYEDGDIMRLQAETGAGNWPDLFAFSQRGTLAEMRDELTLDNLYDYLDADTELSRDDLMQPVLRAMEQDGALYWLPWKFWIQTLIGPESLIGQPGISVEDARRIARENDLVPIQQWITREGLLETYSAVAAQQFVDWDSGTCSFDSEEFASILELCAELPASADVSDGLDAYTGPNDPSLLDKYFVMNPMLLTTQFTNRNGDFCFAGYPDAAGNGSLFYIPLKLAITAGAQEKQGAWEFIRFVLGEEEQSADVAGGNNGLCMNAAAFEWLLDELVKAGPTAYGNNREFTVEFTADDARKLRELVDGTVLVLGADPTLEKIISDCAAAYFAGEKSAEEAARDIQGRAGIYVSERN
ncbi:MAG: hypothetical protein NC319_06530 [Butyricicoccus sp.]|nr:hypothetical protein [Butyricicoccus sp.]